MRKPAAREDPSLVTVTCTHVFSGKSAVELARELAGIGEQEQSLRVEVEAADRDHPRQVRRKILEHRGTPLRIAMGRHQAGRLVVAPQAGLGPRGQKLAIDHDLVGVRHGDRGAGQLYAVHQHAARNDPALSLPARAKSCICHALGDTLAFGFGRFGHTRACQPGCEAAACAA